MRPPPARSPRRTEARLDRRPPPRPEGVEARAAALSLVRAALSRRGGLEDGLGEPALAALSDRDRALARAISGAVLRRLGPIDRLLHARMAKAPPPEVLDLLRLGAAQLAALRVPAFAAVSTTVELAGRNPSTRPFRGLVNAVLRGIERDGGPELIAGAPPDSAFPEWLAARWRAQFGEPALVRLAEALAEEPPTDLSLRDPADAPDLARELGAEPLPGGSLRTPLKGDLAAWPGYAEGRWWVQDAAAAAPARLLDVRRGETALDLCAAPGGKTLQLAAAGARVTSVDRSAARLERLRQNLQRTGLEAEIVVADAADWDEPRQFDAVLLDAPCSATGTFRRHPDVLWTARPGDIGKLSTVQARLLDAAADRVAPGGRLVYCVCSLEPEEGEAQLQPFLARRSGFRLEATPPPLPGVEDAGGGWRLTPAAQEPPGGCDGFFMAKLRREG